MTVVLTVACQGQWSGFPCRGALPTREVSAAAARHVAAGQGWSHNSATGADLCPACTRKKDRES